MLRRSHRKSRNGCLECKRRHIKCDETRPHCLNCTTVDRHCRYATSAVAAERSPSDRSASPQVTPTGSALTPLPPAAGFSGEPHPSAAVGVPHLQVDMVHMELLHHYMTNCTIYPLEEMESCLREIIVGVALEEPYVMYSVLALSSRHLSSVRTERQPFYLNLSMQLQTQALALFNSMDISQYGDSVEKRIPVFIFACVVGVHALCDALSHQDPDPDSAIARFLSYLNLHRGMHTVMHGYWEELKQTKLKVIFEQLVPQWYQVTSEGSECDDIRTRLKTSGLDEEDLKASLHAVELVQWVFDAKPSPESRAYVLCSWVAMLPRPFVRMLEARRPEALAVLAYYFLAMHLCRNVWMMGNAGQHFLNMIADHFRGGEWYSWVETPYRMLQESLEREALKHQSPAVVGGSPSQAAQRQTER